MLGTLDPQAELLDAETLCGHLVPEDSIYRKLAEVGDKLFSDQDFASLYHPARGRRSVPPSLLAKVLLLQSLEGTSDRETVERVRCDLRWKVALGLSLTEEGFHPSLLCYFRERVRHSENPRLVFERFREVAEEAGLLSDRGIRALDSTPVLSAVQTQDTVSLIRGALRRLLRVLGVPEANDMRARLARDDYHGVGKPPIDWDDPCAREALVDELVRDAWCALAVLEGEVLAPQVAEAAELLATVAGQDVEEVEGRFRIRRGVAPDRVISVVDPQARHGRKSHHGHFDGYKTHLAVDPDTELVTEVAVSPANVPDATVARELLPELDEAPGREPAPPQAGDDGSDGEPGGSDSGITVVADSAYGSGATRAVLGEAGARLVVKAPPEQNTHGGFPKSAFRIDLSEQTATCPAGVTTTVYVSLAKGGGRFQFPAEVCASCPLRGDCTSSAEGRSVTVGPHEALLAQARAFQATEEFREVYRGKRPTVERVIYRVTRNGGRKARYRGQEKVEAQQRLKAAAENLVRMFRLGLVWGEAGWAIA